MAKKKKVKDASIEEREEAEDLIRSMVRELDKLPTDVLRQLCFNLDEIDKYNEKHHLNSGSSRGAYAVAGLEELLESNESFLSICLLYEHIKTRMVDETKPLQAILLFETDEDVKDWTDNLSWLASVVNVVTCEVKEKEGYPQINFISDWNLHGELILLSLESIHRGLPKEIAEHLTHGCRVSLHKGDYDEAFFQSLLK